MSSGPNAATVTGPSQLRVPPVSVPPGVTAAPQPPTVPVPPPQYPSLTGISLSHNPMERPLGLDVCSDNGRWG